MGLKAFSPVNSTMPASNQAAVCRSAAGAPAKEIQLSRTANGGGPGHRRETHR